MMNFEMFKEEIIRAVEETTRKGCLVRVEEIRKNNGVILNGLYIVDIKEQESPVIYLEPLYEEYTKSQDQKKAFQTAVETVVRLYRENKDIFSAKRHIKELFGYEEIKGKIMYKLINTQENRELLEQIPNIPYLDLSIVFYLCLEEKKNGIYTAMINNKHKELWCISNESLYHQAMENTQKAFPASLKSLHQIMCDLVLSGEIEGYPDKMEMEPLIYVLSNKDGRNGAGAILYENVLEKFSQERHCDLIILPSSVHEGATR